jgi:dihydroxy-acid dehydratase
MAICGSTNAVLHLSAVVNEAQMDMNVVKEFKTLNRTTPQIARVNPAAKWDMEAFHKAGGIPRVMSNLGDILDTEVLTCTGRTLKENLADYVYQYPENKEIIRDRESPFSATGGIAVLHGNLAPDTAISKPGAIDPSLHVFTGKARVFDSEEDAEKAILEGKIEAGNVVVIRYEGPKGGPGMREMFKAMKYLYGMGLNRSTALITDGRFSGTNNGCFVGHISPEAAEGGPLAIVEDGDEIHIDVIDGLLQLNVDDAEMERRLKVWVRPCKPVPRGYLALYARVASSADKGAVIDPGSLFGPAEKDG